MANNGKPGRKLLYLIQFPWALILALPKLSKEFRPNVVPLVQPLG